VRAGFASALGGLALGGEVDVGDFGVQTELGVAEETDFFAAETG
jgi:hypothetical protein